MMRVNQPYSAATPIRRFRHNPYDLTAVTIEIDDDAAVHYYNSQTMTPPPADVSPSREDSPSALHHMMPDMDGLLHKPLAGRVNYEPFPTVARATPQLPFTKTDCARLFIGQIPYNAPPHQVEWMVHAATGLRVYFTEKIQRWTGSRTPKGCAHTYCLPGDVAAIKQMLHKRVLVDDTGIWIAADDQQEAVLSEYCKAMKEDKKLRFRDRPYQPVVVEDSESTFVPRRPSPPPHQLAEDGAVPLPPMYGDFMHTQSCAPMMMMVQRMAPPTYYAATYDNYEVCDF